MKHIKVLIIDNDVLVRQAFARTLSNSPSPPEIRVSGDIEESETIIRQENPDVVLLDMKYSASGNYRFFDTLRESYPDLPVVAVSSRSEAGARAANYALCNGAVDAVTKPEQNNVILFAGDHLVKRLPPIVEIAARTAGNMFTSDTVLGNRTGRAKRTDVIVIGGGTGGPQALYSVFNKLPAGLSVPVVVAQHFPKIFTRELAKSLNEISNLNVREASDGTELTPGTAWLARGGYHCEIQPHGNKVLFKVHRGPREHQVRPSIDVLFRSAARMYGPGALGVILSGYGKDGPAGARAVKEAGGDVIAQDPKSAFAMELPLSVLKSGLANCSCSARKIGEEIVRRVSWNKQRPERSTRKRTQIHGGQIKTEPMHVRSV